MTNSGMNKEFLDSIDFEFAVQILNNISSHYGISLEEALEEVTSEGAKHLLDYITGSLREVVQSFVGCWGLE